MKKLLLCAITVAALGLHARAATETAQSTSEPAAPAAATEPVTAAPTLELKNKSSFEFPDNGRNPFWPIGWKPSPKSPNASAEPAGPEVQASAFVVSSIVMDPRARFAIINGEVMNEGQVFGLQMGSSTYQITVKAIQDGQVILVRGRDQEIVVPLRRR